MMTREEELARLISDRDMAEGDADLLGSEIRVIEARHPDDYEEREDWNDLHYEINALEAEAMYLTMCIEDFDE